jgi:hypothetical protein
MSTRSRFTLTAFFFSGFYLSEVTIHSSPEALVHWLQRVLQYSWTCGTHSGTSFSKFRWSVLRPCLGYDPSEQRAVHSSETSVNLYQTTRRHIPQDNTSVTDPLGFGQGRILAKLLLLAASNCGHGRRGHSISRGAGGAVIAAWVLQVWNVASWSVVRCIVQYVVSAGNIFCSESSSQRHNSKRTVAHAPKQCFPSAQPKLSATDSTCARKADAQRGSLLTGFWTRRWLLSKPHTRSVVGLLWLTRRSFPVPEFHGQVIICIWKECLWRGTSSFVFASFTLPYPFQQYAYAQVCLSVLYLKALSGTPLWSNGRVPGYKTEVPGSIPSATRFSEK